ncbi:protein trafficking Pga2 [Terfezia claveryi]|nr:protein trafficking Pga2 [Terfezia claveryi]
MTEFIILGRTFNVYEILRLVIIVGAYLLFRPYLLKLTQKFQERDHARPVASGEESSPAAVGDSANESTLAEDEEESDGEDMSWGAKARRRKRAGKKAIKQLIDEEERRIAEEESDEEIAEFMDKDN